MSALGHYLEAEGIATVSISLVREHTEQMNPPRALWVPFELGRPLGEPGDAAFQKRVLDSALSLLAKTDGPMLVDFPDDAPSHSGNGEGETWACPVSFPQAAAEETPLAALKREIASLQPWFDLGRERRGRTTFGLSGLSLEALAENLVGYAERGADHPNPIAGLSDADGFKHVNDDIQAFYQEAATAQPGHGGSHADVLDWFWGGTEAGRLLLASRDAIRESENKELRFIVNALMVPRLAASRLGI